MTTTKITADAVEGLCNKLDAEGGAGKEAQCMALLSDLWKELAAANERAEEEANEAHEIGKRAGFDEAVQKIDMLTGGDGEYRFCTDFDPERHCPDAETMMKRIVARFAETDQ